MNMHPLANYTLKDFDKYNCVKLSFSYYLILLYLLRGYAIGMASLANLKDKLSLIQWFYPDSTMFYLSLLFSIPNLVLLYVVIARKPDAHKWLKVLWRKVLPLSILLITIDLLIYWGQYLFVTPGSLSRLLIQTAVAVSILLYCTVNARAKMNRLEFPEHIEDKPKDKGKSP